MSELTAEEREALTDMVATAPPASAVIWMVERILAARASGGLADRVRALADEWATEGTSLVKNPYDAREVHEGSTMQSCADLLRALLDEDPT